MIEFLTNNWKFVATIGLIFIELILFLVFKKRPTILDTSFFADLCRFVEEAEKKYGADSGVNKMKYVLLCAKEEFGEYYNEQRIREVVEWILTLPEKKEK